MSDSAIPIESPAPIGGARERVVGWIARYGLAEVIGIVCALAASVGVHRATGSLVAAGYAGAWAESLGYAAVIAVRDVASASRAATAAGRPLGARDGRVVIAGWIAEFGPAGLLDTFVTRPLAMALGARLLGPKVGLVVGKLVGDVLFYLPVIITYERRRLRERRLLGGRA